MKAFGLELRKANSLSNLYNDVDNILNSYSTPIEVHALSHSLQKMITSDSYFSVCTIKDCSKMCQIVIPQERINVYQSIHCMNWNQMEESFRTRIVAMILDDFRSILNQ